MLREFLIQPVILSGGSGTRLWPLSRYGFPKQYINLQSSSDLSFLQKTQTRLKGLENLEDPIIICNEEQRFLVAEQMREIMIKPKSIILEPCGRNTAPAIAIAALKVSQMEHNPFLLVLSSDHEIKNSEKFKDVIKKGLVEASKDKLVIFGVKPTRPETGYGYIKTVDEISISLLQSSPIEEFIEKPNEEVANQLIKNNHYLWNSGIFLFRAKTILQELKEHQPDLLELCKKSLQNSSLDLDFQRLHSEFFNSCPDISIDKAVMEKTKNVQVLELDAGWSDVGNWKALWDIEKKDENGNVIIGDVKAKEVKNCYLNSQNKLLVSCGIEDLIIVQTNDATLVVKSESSQKIKEIVNQLNLEGRSEGSIHRKVFRPWGYYDLIEKSLNWQVKEIQVNPKSSLSLQRHEFRAEHWIVLKGKANIEIDDAKFILKENESTYIPIGAKHRLTNNQEIPLVLIEVQSGSYLSEDDIYRFEDVYGRTSKNSLKKDF